MGINHNFGLPDIGEKWKFQGNGFYFVGEVKSIYNWFAVVITNDDKKERTVNLKNLLWFEKVDQ